MKLESLSKNYGNINIFKNISANFEPNKIYSIFGRNGVGKTTLLNIMNGNLKYDSGNIELTNDSILMETNEFPFDFMTANEMIETVFAFKETSYSTEMRDELYYKLDFDPDLKEIRAFSKGMKSKLYLIIALLSNPRVLLLDEPFSDIDLKSFQIIIQLLKKRKKNTIIILSTHSPKIAYELSDEIMLLTQDGLHQLPNEFGSVELLEQRIVNYFK